MRLVIRALLASVLLFTLTAMAAAAEPASPANRKPNQPGAVGSAPRSRVQSTPVPVTVLAVTVTSVSGQTITASDRQGAAVTIVTNDQATIRKGRDRASASDIVAGARLSVRGQRGDDGTIVARDILIAPEQFSGRVTAVGDSSLTLTPRGQNGATGSVTVVVSSGTRIFAGATGTTLASVRVGSQVSVEAYRDASGQLVAATIRVQPDRLGGRVTASTTTSVTLETRSAGGTATETVAIGASTRVTRGRATAALADLAVGDQVSVTGYRNEVGTLTADLIQIMPRTVSGTVTAIAGSSLTLETRTSTGTATETVAVSSSTRVTRGRTPAIAVDVVVGDRVSATGYRDATGALAADLIQVFPSSISGIVRVATSDSLTIETRAANGAATQTVAIGSSTRVTRGRTLATLADITVGDQVMATGYRTATGALAADAIQVLPRTISGIVKAIAESSITVETRSASGTATETVAVSATTRVLRGRTQVTAADIAVGDRVAGTGYRDSAGALAADTIQIFPHTISGVVKSATVDTLTLETRSASGTATETVAVSNSTRVARGRAVATLADIVVGDRVTVTGYRNAAGTLSADAIQILPRTVSGTVTAVAGSSFTLETRTSTGTTGSTTVQTMASTRFSLAQGTGSLADVTVGSRVAATGFADASGTLAADLVRVAPALALSRHKDAKDTKTGLE
ncbi:MAG: hypothetical protein HYY04_15180 [Chloroflexi bacterium]|nr:hypothetical protein [Chloroflexota bacterium]